MSRPYADQILDEKVRIRKFSKDLDEKELLWHRDDKDRLVKVLQSEGWMLQLEDSLPQTLIPGMDYQIAKGQWHRIIAGKEDLVISITED